MGEDFVWVGSAVERGWVCFEACSWVKIGGNDEMRFWGPHLLVWIILVCSGTPSFVRHQELQCRWVEGQGSDAERGSVWSLGGFQTCRRLSGALCHFSFSGLLGNGFLEELSCMFSLSWHEWITKGQAILMTHRGLWVSALLPWEPQEWVGAWW